MQSQLEHILLSSYKKEMILFLKSHPEYFEEAIQLAIGDKEKLCWRSAFVIYDCMDKNDKRIKKHIKKIITVLPNKNDGHQRELIKIISNMELNEEHEGTLFNICMSLWEQIDKSPSVRMTAFKFILKMAQKYPELKEEITFLTQDHFLETLSPGVRHLISKMKKDFS